MNYFSKNVRRSLTVSLSLLVLSVAPASLMSDDHTPMDLPSRSLTIPSAKPLPVISEKEYDILLGEIKKNGSTKAIVMLRGTGDQKRLKRLVVLSEIEVVADAGKTLMVRLEDKKQLDRLLGIGRKFENTGGVIIRSVENAKPQ